MENGPFEDVFSYKKWGYSITMLVYQRVRGVPMIGKIFKTWLPKGYLIFFQENRSENRSFQSLSPNELVFPPDF